VPDAIERFNQIPRAQGIFEAGRADQAREALGQALREGLLERLIKNPIAAQKIEAVHTEVASGRLIPAVAAQQLLDEHNPKEGAQE
jgi:putative protein kinase ArgK-like GTPase of G3E family